MISSSSLRNSLDSVLSGDDDDDSESGEDKLYVILNDTITAFLLP